MPVADPTVLHVPATRRLASGFLALALVFLQLAPVAAAEITTDLWIYQYGDTVTVSGDGFGANEGVELVTTDPYAVEVDRGTAVTDEFGNFVYQFVLLSDVPGIYDVVATGLSSGFSAATQFDPVNKCVDVTSSTLTWMSGGFTLNLAGTLKSGGGCTAAPRVTVEVRNSDGVNNVATGSVVASGTATISSLNWTHSFSFPALSPADGTYDIKASGTGVGTSCSSDINYCGISDDYFGVDNTAPTSAVTTLSGSASGVTASGTASDATSGFNPGNPKPLHVEIRSGGPSGATFVGSGVDFNVSGAGNWGPFAAPAYPTSPGHYCVVSIATDRAGNIQPDLNELCYDIASPNTPPSVSVTGVSDGSSYVKNSVPAAGCSVTDAEDGNSSFAATLSPITGPDSAYGIGSQTASCSYTDGGGLTASASATYSITDGTAPSISYVLTPSAPDGDNGWFVSHVALAWTVDEGDSPSTLVIAGCVDQSLTADQAATDYSCEATSAGGATGPVTVSIKIDQSAPVISDDGPTTLANGNGWYNTNVTNAFSVDADISGPDAACAAAFPGGSQTKTTSGEGFTLNVTSDSCTDLAGNTASGLQSADFQVDQSAPTNIAYVGGGLTEGGSYYFGFVPAGPTGCTADFSISGEDTSSDGHGCDLSGYSVSVGSHDVLASATDLAGNTGYGHLHYTVLAWTLSGFYQPVDNFMLNTVKNGSTVPLKFEVFAGSTELTSTDVVDRFVVQEVGCESFEDLSLDPIEFVTTGGTSLRYDSTAGQFIQNWKTPKTAGRCYRVSMYTDDGSNLAALFKLK